MLKIKLKNKKGIFIWDCDDALLIFIPAFIKYVKKHFGRKIKLKEFTSYKFHEVYGVGQKTMNVWMDKFYKSKEFANLKPEPGAQRLITLLVKAGYFNGSVTARTSDTRDVTQAQFDDLYPNQILELDFTKDSLSGKRWKKSDLIFHLYGDHIDGFIDDAGHNAVDVAEKYPNALVFLLRKHWNKDFQDLYARGELPSNITCVETYEEVEAILREKGIL